MFIVVIVVVTGLLLSVKHARDEHLKQFFYYRQRPLTFDKKNYRLILIWTPLQMSYGDWIGIVGPDDVIQDCGDAAGIGEHQLDNKCIVTTNKEYVNHADVILFSLQNMKQVDIYINFYTHL